MWYNGEDDPEIAAAIEEERASARSRRHSPKARRGEGRHGAAGGRTEGGREPPPPQLPPARAPPAAAVTFGGGTGKLGKPGRGKRPRERGGRHTGGSAHPGAAPSAPRREAAPAGLGLCLSRGRPGGVQEPSSAWKYVRAGLPRLSQR